MDEPTTTVRFALGTLMLVGSVVYDLGSRRVPNPWWVPFAWLAGLLVASDLLVVHARPDQLGLAVVRYGVVLVFCTLVYALWRSRLFGGADAKALVVLALLAPWPPVRPHALQPALDALTNGALAMLLIPVAFLATNALRGHLAFPAALLGTRMPLAAARRAHVWPMQVPTDGGLRWRFWQRIGGDLSGEYLALERAGVREVWATPKVPFLVPLALGWLLAWWQGNLVLLAVDVLRPT